LRRFFADVYQRQIPVRIAWEQRGQRRVLGSR